MNWKAKVAAFVKQLGPACKFTAKTVLSTMIPGSPAVIELVERALDCASSAAENVWEVEKDNAAAKDLERIGILLETMQKQLGAGLKQIASLEGDPDRARRILDASLANNVKLRQVGEQLQIMAAGFDRLEVQIDRVAGRQELSLDMQQQMLDMHRLSIGLMLTMYGENGSNPELREQFRSALAALGEGRVAAAHPTLTALFKVLPGSSAVQGALGVVQAVENDLPGAQVSLQRATRLNPTNQVLQRLSERVTRFLTEGTPVDAPLRVGQNLGGWAIIQLLGSGGAGQVVKGRKGEQIAALKVLHPRLSQDETILADFRKEMMAMMRLGRQRHLTEILDFGFCQQQRRWYFVMAFVQGMSLQTYLDRHGPLSLEQAVTSFRPVAEALGQAHALEIVHRDVKPANLMRAEDGSLTLVDFGLAGVPTARGTLAFTAPEQLRGQSSDARSDVYSLAATFYHALTLKPPEHFERGCLGQEGLDDLLALSLARMPQNRPANAAEFAARLQLEPQTVSAPAPLEDRQEAATQIQPLIEKPYDDAELAKSRMVMGLIAASLVGVLIAVVAIIITVSSDPGDNGNKKGDKGRPGSQKEGANPILPPVRKPLVVNSSGENGAIKTLQQAIDKASNNDRIVVESSIAESVRLHNKTRLVIEGKLGNLWKPPASGFSPETNPTILLDVGNCTDCTIRNFVMDGDTAGVMVGVNTWGKCPGVVLDGLQIQNYTWAGVYITNTAGESDNPLTLQQLRFVTRPVPTEWQPPAGILFAVLPKLSVRKNQHITIRDCVPPPGMPNWIANSFRSPPPENITPDTIQVQQR